MRFSTIALAASATSSVLAATSICDKYTVALLKDNTGANQYTLLTLLVNTAVIGNFTGKGSANPTLPGSLVDVPGILAPATMNGESVNLAQYFDGSLLSTNNNGKAASVNFLDGGGATPIIKDPTSSGSMGSAQYLLLTHLYQYFGALLGCSKYGMSGFPAYGGDPSMGEVHRFMVLSANEFAYFVSQVGGAAASFGVTDADIKAAAGALNGAFGSRCAPAAAIIPNTPKQPQSICTASDCPMADMADCSLYPTEPEPAPANSGPSPSGGGSSPSTSPVVPPMTSSNPTPAPGAAAAPTAAAGMVVAAAGALAAALL